MKYPQRHLRALTFFSKHTYFLDHHEHRVYNLHPPKSTSLALGEGKAEPLSLAPCVHHHLP